MDYNLEAHTFDTRTRRERIESNHQQALAVLEEFNAMVLYESAMEQIFQVTDPECLTPDEKHEMTMIAKLWIRDFVLQYWEIS
ncbi:MAG: hypothetical protein JJ902_05230 [Roseibium sp.]|nr:hypothetical protein [Roseibium sp.]